MTYHISKKKPYIELSNHVVAIPSCHSDVVFAQLVFMACCQQKPFECIAVELPQNIPASLLNGVNERHWQPGVFAITQDDRSTVSSMVKGKCVDAQPICAVPNSGTDSITMAMMLPKLLQKQWSNWNPQYYFIDAPVSRSPDANRGHHSMASLDSSIALCHGLEHFCEIVNTELDRVGCHAQEDRDRAMAERIAWFIREQKRTLVIYGAAHHRGIKKLLDDDIAPVPPRQIQSGESRTHPKFIPVPAPLAFLQGWLDLPRVAWEWRKACVREGVSGFAKGQVLEKVLVMALNRFSRSSKAGVSPRRYERMQAFLHGVVQARGHIVPHWNDLRKAATACVGEGFAQMLERIGMMYPSSSAAPNARILLTDDNGLLLGWKGKWYLCTRQFKTHPAERFRAYDRSKGVSRKHAKSSDVENGRYFVPAVSENRLRRQVNEYVRKIAHRQAREIVSIPFNGGYQGLGPDVRRLVRSRAVGDSRRFIRHPVNHLRQCSNCPIVWLFSPGQDVVSSEASYHPTKKFGRVFCCFYWYSHRISIGSSATRSKIAYWLSLMDESPGENEPPGELEDCAQSMVGALAVERRCCRTPPWLDWELRHFQGPSRPIAAAIKYAADHVTIVSHPDVEFDEEVIDYAYEKSVRLLRVSSLSFDARLVERLAIDHALATHRPYALPAQQLEDLVEAIPLDYH